MSGLPDPRLLILGLLAAAALLAMLRLARHRRWLLLALQLPLAGLLALTLLWQPAAPPRPLILLTAGSSDAQIDALRGEYATAHWRRLPGAPAVPDAPLSVDVASALRETSPSQIVLLGDGLDREQLATLGALPTRFLPLPWDAPAISALSTPPAPAPGQRWRIDGEVQAARSGLSLHLLDPGGRDIDQSLIDKQGRFALRASSPLAGRLDYAIELREGEQVLQRLPYRLQTQDAPSGRGLLWAAAPSAELKFLRRWALDAGIALDARIGLRPGLAVGQGNDLLRDAALAELDVLIIDQRSWSALGARRAAIIKALRGGLGVLLRLEQADDPATLSALRDLGLGLLIDGEESGPLSLETPALRLAPGTALHALPLRVEASAAGQLADQDALGQAAWVAVGRGRLGASWLLDSYQYAQQGQAEVHASHWAALWQAVARPRPPSPRWQAVGDTIAGQRLELCGKGEPPILRDAEGRSLSGLRTAAHPCVAYWPAHPGRWEVSDPSAEATRQWIDVLPAQPSTSLQRAERRRASTAHANAFPLADSGQSPSAMALLQANDGRPLKALLLGAWLLLAGLIGWLERRILLSRP